MSTPTARASEGRAEVVGVDVGGTFTDLIALGPDDDVIRAKVLSTADDPSQGFVDGLAALAAQRGEQLEAYCAAIERIVHGTTVATNATLTSSGARTALLTTAGFRDTLEMRLGVKEDQHDNRYQAPEPLVARHLRLGIDERTDSEGIVLAEPDLEQVSAALDRATARGAEAIAICFLHSYRNPQNEVSVGRFVRERHPHLFVTLSSELLPQMRFYERTSTTAFNAYVGPILATYLARLVERLARHGFAGQLLVMQSNGGVVAPQVAARRAAGALLSGPAAGPAAGAAFVPEQPADCITADMGGTSFDVALVRGGRPVIARDAVFDRRVVALPTSDIHAIGAGGGSIGWIDDGGLLRMGPASAGARPGPACYGFGGAEPTCTDANLLLGLLDPGYFAGGRMQLEPELASEAIRTRIADPLGLPLLEAAAGMHDVINVNMAMGVRAVSVNRGIDPREVPLVVGGGCGPLHAARIAEELGMTLVVIPPDSGIFCAMGMLLSDFRHDHVHAHFTTLDGDLDWEAIRQLVGAMRADGERALDEDGVPPEDRRFELSLDVRYVEQHREIEVPMGEAELAMGDLDPIRRRFDGLHERLYGHCLAAAGAEIVHVRMQAIGIARKLPLGLQPRGAESAAAACKGSRSVYVREQRVAVPADVYDGSRLVHGSIVQGPALVEEPNTTIFVPPAFTLRCDARGSRVLIHETAEVPA